MMDPIIGNTDLSNYKSHISPTGTQDKEALSKDFFSFLECFQQWIKCEEIGTDGSSDDEVNAIEKTSGTGDDTGNSQRIQGGAGDDTIKVTVMGESTIHGGAGNDIIDLFISKTDLHFNAGDGIDTVTGASGFDTLIFGEGLSPDRASYELTNNNLTIKFEGSSDQVILKGWRMEDSPRMQFSDGTILNGSDIQGE